MEWFSINYQDKQKEIDKNKEEYGEESIVLTVAVTGPQVND